MSSAAKLTFYGGRESSGNAIFKTDKQIPNKSRFGELFTGSKQEIMGNAIPETRKYEESGN